MQSEEELVIERLCQWVFDELDRHTFVDWICQEARLEPLLGKTLYLDLLSFDYSTPQGKFESVVLVKNFLLSTHREYCQKREVVLILKEMIADKIPLVRGLRQLVKLYHNGYDFIPINFVGYESETDSVPDPKQKHLWNGLAFWRGQRSLRLYRNAILREAKKFLEDLTSGAK